MFYKEDERKKNSEIQFKFLSMMRMNFSSPLLSKLYLSQTKHKQIWAEPQQVAVQKIKNVFSVCEVGLNSVFVHLITLNWNSIQTTAIFPKLPKWRKPKTNIWDKRIETLMLIQLQNSAQRCEIKK